MNKESGIATSNKSRSPQNSRMPDSNASTTCSRHMSLLQLCISPLSAEISWEREYRFVTWRIDETQVKQTYECNMSKHQMLPRIIFASTISRDWEHSKQNITAIGNLDAKTEFHTGHLESDAIQESYSCIPSQK